MQVILGKRISFVERKWNNGVLTKGVIPCLDVINGRVVKGKADAVLAARIFHYQTYSIGQVKDHLASMGIPIRKTANVKG